MFSLAGPDIHISRLENSDGINARMEEEMLVFGCKDCVDKHLWDLVETHTTALLPLFAGKIEQELRFEAVPRTLFVSSDRGDPGNPPIMKPDTSGFGAEERSGTGIDLDPIPIDAVVPGRI